MTDQTKHDDMKLVHLRLRPDQIDWLKSQPGTMSRTVREAIDAYREGHAGIAINVLTKARQGLDDLIAALDPHRTE